jgi:hypothetical protein
MSSCLKCMYWQSLQICWQSLQGATADWGGVLDAAMAVGDIVTDKSCNGHSALGRAVQQPCHLGRTCMLVQRVAIA